MDYDNARWVKLYCQDTGTWLRLGWQGRTVALHLLRSVNLSGVLSDLGTEPELILAELLRLPLDVVTPGLAALVRTGTVTLGGGILVWTAFRARARAAPAIATQDAGCFDKTAPRAHRKCGGFARFGGRTFCPPSLSIWYGCCYVTMSHKQGIRLNPRS